jgi:hypothetical protein
MAERMPAPVHAALTHAEVQTRKSLSIPSVSKGVNIDLSQYLIVIYAREGWGKTTAFASWPEMLFFGFEPGTKHLDVREFFQQNSIEPSWEGFRSAVDLLCPRSGARLPGVQSVCMDTTDRMYNLCSDCVCKELGIDHISLDVKGKRDRSGMGWDAVKKEFTTQLYRLAQRGYGVTMTSHSKLTEVETAAKQTFSIITPSMSGQALTVVRQISNYIFYGEYMKCSDGQTHHILITQGDEFIVAKSQGLQGRRFPKYLLLPDPDDGSGDTAYAMIRDVFLGERGGVDPANFVLTDAGKRTSASVVARSLMSDKARAAALRLPGRINTPARQ